MKCRKIIQWILIVLAILAVFVSILAIFWPDSLKQLFNISNIGDAGTWFSGTFTVLAIIVAFYEIIETRQQFEKEHVAKLNVYTACQTLPGKTDENGKANEVNINLHIIPVNEGLDAGSYRLLGICKIDNLSEVKEIIDRVRNHSEKENDYARLAELICINDNKLGESSRETNGKSILFPSSKNIFQIIKGKGVGKIEDFSLKENIKEKDSIAVIYINPKLELFDFNVELNNDGKKDADEKSNGS